MTEGAGLPEVQVGSARASPGERVRGSLSIELGGGAAVELPVVILQGTSEGPSVLVSGGMHGNEVNGVVAANRVLHEIHPQQLRGTLIVLPVLNPGGFAKEDRYVPQDGADLNRAFPGAHDGTASQRLAFALWDQVLPQVLVGVDFHDAGLRNVLLPHPRIHTLIEPLNPGATDITLAMGQLMGTDVILQREGKAGMLATEARHHLGVPVINFEIGGAGIVMDDFVTRGLVGLTNLLKRLEMLEGVPQVPHVQFVLEERDIHKCSIGGVLTQRKELGEWVSAGEVVSTIVDPLTDGLEQVRATRSGVLLSMQRRSRIEAGRSVFSLLAFDGDPSDLEALKNQPGQRVISCDDTRCAIIPNKVLALALQQWRSAPPPVL